MKIIYLFQKSRRRPWTSIGQPLVFSGMDESDSESLAEIEFHLKPDELMDEEDDPGASEAESRSEPQHRSESTPKRISAKEV